MDTVLADSKELEFIAEVKELRKEGKHFYVGYIWGLDVKENTAYFGTYKDNAFRLVFKTGDNGLPVGDYFITPTGLKLPYDSEKYHLINYIDVEEELYVRGDYE